MDFLRARSALQAFQSWLRSSRASKRRRHWPDSIRPTRMPLTRTPLGANSVAMERTRFLRPARAAEVATMCGSGCEASSELRSEEHTSELQSQSNLVCRLLLEKKKKKKDITAVVQ